MPVDRLAQLRAAKAAQAENNPTDFNNEIVEEPSAPTEVDIKLEEFAQTNTQIKQISETINSLKQRHVEILNPGVNQDETSIRNHADELNSKISSLASDVNRQLKSYKIYLSNKRKQAAEHSDPHEAQLLRHDCKTLQVHFNAMTSRFKEVMTVHSEVQVKHRDDMKEKLKKQLRLIDDKNEFDDDELEMMIDDGDYSLFDDGFKDAQEKKKVLGELESRKDAMKKLEQDMQKLYELFAEIALLVEQQGEQVDNVMANVINTEAYR